MANSKITADNVSALILILNWLFCIYQFLITMTLIISKMMFRRPDNAHDIPTYLASAVLIVQAGVETIRIRSGLGRHWSVLTPSEQLTYEKTTYTINILYFLVMGLSEASVCLFIGILSPMQWHRNPLKILVGVVGAWAIAGMLGMGIQCGGGSPWTAVDGSCFHRNAWWNVMETINLFINLALVIAPLVIVLPVRINVARKTSIGFLFSLRLCVCAAIICKLVFWNRTATNPDISFAPWPSIVSSMIVQMLSVITYCILSLRPLFDSIGAGFIRSDNIRRRGQMGSIGESLGGYYSSPTPMGGSARRMRIGTSEEQVLTQTSIDDRAWSSRGGGSGGEPSHSPGGGMHILRVDTFEVASAAAGRGQAFDHLAPYRPV